jgi:hypothetical protein
MLHNPGRLTAIVFLAAAGHASACTIEHAKYVYSVDKNITVEFENKGKLEGWMSPLVLSVSLGKAKPTYWFLFDQGAARYTYLISTTDATLPQWQPPDPDSSKNRPLGFMEYFAWNSDLRVKDLVPKPGDAAPEVIFLPDLPDKLASQGTPRMSIEPGLFTLQSCGR